MWQEGHAGFTGKLVLMAIASLVAGLIGPILEPLINLIPNKNDRAKAREAAEAQIVTAMTGLVQGQLEINKVEAQHGSIFVAGWRPAVGWICGVALGWNFVLQPLLLWLAWIIPEGADLANAPKLDTGELMTVLLGMLGLGGLRTYEKRVGVARTKMGEKD
jgi:hypothetical protein